MLRPLLLALATCLLLPVAMGSTARDVTVLRRERQARELRRLLDYRRERRIPTATAAEDAVAAAETQTERLKQAIGEEDPAAFDQTLATTDEHLAAARSLLDQHWPDGLVLRTGVGTQTFGRYGWRNQFGGLVWDLVSWDRLASPAETSPVRISPPGATLGEQQTAQVSWTSARHNGTVQTATGAVSWNLTESILAPGILVETEAEALVIARGDKGTRGPDRILVPVLDSAIVRNRQSDPALPIPEDNWLLLCWETNQGEPPVLLVFEQIPDRFDWSESGLTVHCSGGVGKMALGSYAGISAWSPEDSRAWQAVPRSVLRHCRELAALLANFPVGIEEFFAVDEVRGEVEIADLLQTVPFAFSGRVPKQPATPLPPALTTAAHEGVSQTLPPFVQDWTLETRAGLYRVSSGASNRFRLPILRYDHPVEPALPTAPAAALVLPDSPSTADLCLLFPIWTGLSATDRERLARTAKDLLAAELNRVVDGSGHATEPNSQVVYLDWSGKGSLATLRQSALLLDATYRYAKFTGDWEFVRSHTPALAELLDVQMAMADWAFLSPSPTDALPADALPEALRGALAMGQMAEAIQDREALRRSRYLAARLLVPYAAGFLAQNSNPANRWSEKELPATWGDETFAGAVARVAGTPVVPELVDAGLAACRLEVRDWLREALPRQHPEWLAQDPACAAEFWWLLRLTAPGSEPGEAAKATLIASLDAGSPLRHLLAFTPTHTPIRLAEWQPAALGAFLYDSETRIARLEITGAATLRCTVDEEPSEIRHNGAAIPRPLWSYSRELGRIAVRLDDGPHALEFVFAPTP